MNNRYIMIFALAAVLFGGSCSTMEQSETGYGYLDLDIAADAQVSDAVTKAEALSEADYQTYNISLYKDGVMLWSTSYAEFVSDVDNVYRRVPAGTYMVYVESCTLEEAEEGSGLKRLAGESEFIITAGRTTSATIDCVVVNAMVTVAYDDAFLSTFTNPGISITGGKREVALTFGHEEVNAVYFNADEEGTVALTYTLTAGLTANPDIVGKRYDVSFSAEAGKWNKVTLTAK